MRACIAVNKHEAQGLEAILNQDLHYKENTALFFCGVGLRYKTRLRKELKEFQPKEILILGSCGACKTSLKRGMVLPVNFVKNQHHQEYLLSPGGQGLLTVNKPATSPESKQALAEEYGISAVDMETFSCLRLIQETVPDCQVQCFRIVLDELYESLPNLKTIRTNVEFQARYRLVQATMNDVFSRWLNSEGKSSKTALTT